MEKLPHPSERNIMPPDLLKHYIEGRAKARFRTGEATYFPDPTQPGFKCFSWQNPNLPFYFEDKFANSTKRPGDFGGHETNKAESDKGEMLSFYNYIGGLTDEGLELGENEVYDKVLQRFLEEHAEDIRFGKNVSFSFEDKNGVWSYKGVGEILPWGWKDKETISRNDIVLYELNGSGVCFVNGF